MNLSEDARMIRDAVAEFATARLEPTAHDRDQAAMLDRSLLAELAELGLFGITIPEEAGGVGLGPVALAVALEELAARCPSTALAVLTQAVLGAGAIHALGSDAIRGDLLDGLVGGQTLATLAAGGPVEGEADGDEIVASGRVLVVPSLAAADRVLVEVAGPTRSVHLLEPTASGVAIDGQAPPLGMRAAGLADLVLDGVRLDAASRLDAAGLDDVLAEGRLGLAAIAVGIARGALEAGRTYALERTQFGRPLATLGAIRVHLAEMALDLETARRMVHGAALGLESDPPEAGLAVSMAKLHAADAAVRVSDRSVQIHGGYGYCAEYPAERFYRDAQVPRSLLSTDDQERSRIADRILA